MAFAETAPLIAKLDLKGDFASKLGKAQGALGKFSGSLGKAGKGVGQLSAGFARIGVIAAGVAAGGLVTAAKAAIDFEDAFAGVRKTINEADLTKVGLSFDSLAKSFRGMATEIPIAATEFARIGEAAGALGVKAQDIEEFTKTVALLGVTTDLTSDQAAESLGKIGTILNLTGKQFTNFGDILVALGNNGASTESEIIEITKRFAAAGKTAGLSTAEILAFASAIASAGVEPEAAGSSLSRLFGNLVLDTANATTAGKNFAKVTGKSFKDFSKIVKDDTVGAMMLFLKSIKGLDKFEQARALASVGITNVRDVNAIRLLAQTYETNLIPAIETAKNAQGALSAEAQKRFDTLKSQIQLLKNNITEAFITVGEGFLPALKNATEKLIAFLKVDANKSALMTLGKDIGKTLDEIDWDGVLQGTKDFVAILRDAAGIAKGVLDTLNKLPTEIKAAGIGFIALNKLSGGLLGSGAGNVVGGLASTLIKAGGSRIPVIGAAFAQPVFVTNFPPGFGAGGLPAAAGAVGAGALTTGLALTTAVLAPLAVGAAALIIQDRVDKQGNALVEQATEFAAKANNQELAQSIDGVREQLAKQALNPFNVKGEIADTLNVLIAEQNRRKLNPAIPGTPTGTVPSGTNFPIAMSAAAVEAANARGRAAGFHPTFASGQATIQRNLERLAAANVTATNNVATQVGDTRSELAGIRNAVAAAKPPVTNVAVNVTVTAAQVTKSVTIQKRYGPPGGSRERGPTEFN